jgi:hypothetical protein
VHKSAGSTDHQEGYEHVAATNDSVVHQTPVRYVCLPGSRFTGSTLLGSLLNEHPECVSIGAATGLIRQTDLTTYRCSCGELFRECEFWNYVAARTLALGHPVDVFTVNFWNTHLRLAPDAAPGRRDARYLLNGALLRPLRWEPLNRMRDVLVGAFPGTRRAKSQMAWNTWSLATAVLERTGKQVFVDTSRDHQRPRNLAPFPMLDVKVVHLVRDPRGNSASMIKHTGADAASAARMWAHSNREAARARRYFLPERWLSLRYEELCADPAGVLDRIARFLNVGPMPRDGFRDSSSHIIGNKMRMKGLAEIREDLSWHTTLSDGQLSTIARIAGRVSHQMGYQWP